MIDTIDVPVYVTRGNMMIRRDALSVDDPNHTYNYLISKGIVPEDYGINKPPGTSRCPHCGEIIS